MHYRNGREAKNGDKIVSINTYTGVLRTGILVDAQPGNNYCNGMLVPLAGGMPESACLVDCLHLDDVLEMIGGAARPAGK
ncbi:MAG: hypothetical protein KGL39_51845 [Patescibacteria group bacterium]|nr:hypothetical protein [Patescibacteria group bacterium]